MSTTPGPAAALATVLRAPFTRRTVWEHAYLFVAAPLGFVSLGLTSALLVLGAVYSALLLGVPLVALAVVVARQLGDVRRSLAVSLLDEQVPAPRPVVRRRPGLMDWLRSRLTDLPGWRAVAYFVVSTPVAVAGLYVVVLLWVAAAIGVSYPLMWQVFDPTNTDAQGVERHSGIQFGEYYVDTWPRALMVAGGGLLILLVIPWLVRGVVWVDRRLVRGLLGPGRLTDRMQALEDTRTQAVDDSAATLRRIERDLHDGTQARLVALAMQLDMVREKLTGVGAPGTPDGAGEAGPDDRSGDVAQALELVDTAHRNATDAITELREVTRSIHPPALDRGLDAALATLAARSAIPTVLHVHILQRPSPAIETIAYFCVAELLTNVAKHSGAGMASVDVTESPDRRRLRIRVGDDGAGGARIGDAGSGLAGLVDRLRTVDGDLEIDSPRGGPTAVTIELPSTAGAAPEAGT